MSRTRHEEDGSAGDAGQRAREPKGPSTFRARVFWSVVPIVLLLLTLMGVINVQQHRRLVEGEFMKRGREMAGNLAYGSELGVLAEDDQLLDSSIRAVIADVDGAYVFLYREDGKLLAAGGRGAGDPSRVVWKPSREERLRLLESRQPFSERTPGGYVEFLAPIVSETASTPDELLLGAIRGEALRAAGQGPQAIGFIRLGLSLRPLEQHTLAIWRLWGGLTVVFLALSTLAIYLFSRRVTRPIKQLTDHALKIANGSLDEQIPVESRDEIGQLASSFNEMAHALKGNIGEKERLLAQLQNLNRTLEDRIARRTAQLQERTEALERSLEEVKAMGEVSRAVSSSLDLREVLNTILGHAATLSSSDGCGMVEIDLVRRSFTVVAAHNLSSEFVEMLESRSFDLSVGDLRAAAQERQPVHIPDLELDQGFPLREIMLRAGFRALLAIPMRSEDRFRALVLVRKEPGGFDDRTTDLLSTLASQSQVAIEHARLFQELDEKGRQLEAASRHKSEFLANMSHELRTPLNAIIGFSEVLVEKLFGELNTKQDEYLRDIHGSGHHLLSLINDILDLSKIEAGRVELELDTFELSVALENALTLVKERASHRELSLSMQVDPAIGEFQGDERKIKQILVNLLSNAVKFTPAGGSVTVCVAADADAVTISVTDTGIGIAPEHRDVIFQEFTQVGSDYTHKREGTGLGLALSRRYVELHGGHIWVESELGRGSTFTFTLPLRAEGDEESE